MNGQKNGEDKNATTIPLWGNLWSVLLGCCLAEQARKIEDLGYSTLLVPDGIRSTFDPLVALAGAAEATTTLRLGSYVLCNDFRHPVLQAKGVITLDHLSGGRFEFGLGPGFNAADYHLAAIPYESAGVRISRFEEAIQATKQLFTQETVNFQGKYVTMNDLQGQLKPVQKPYPPIFIGGGGKRMLSIAAREANIVGIHAINTAQGMDVTDSTPQAIEQKVAWQANKKVNWQSTVYDTLCNTLTGMFLAFKEK